MVLLSQVLFGMKPLDTTTMQRQAFTMMEIEVTFSFFQLMASDLHVFLVTLYQFRNRLVQIRVSDSHVVFCNDLQIFGS